MVAKITQLPWTKAQIEHVEVVRINGPQRDTCERKKLYTTYGEADRDATELHRKTVVKFSTCTNADSVTTTTLATT